MFAQLLEIPARYENGDIFYSKDTGLEIFEAKASVYMLDTPYVHTRYDYLEEYERITYVNMVIVSSISNAFTTETMIFPCDATGTLTNWGELASIRHLSHDDALAKIDYLVIK